MTRVWAPRASAVVLHSGPDSARSQDAMTPDAGADGWWEGPELAPGTDYAFEVDGNGPFPDPRSPHQPHGVHGFSRTFDAAAHQWNDAQWPGMAVRGSVLMEVHIGTASAERTLDALADPAHGWLSRLAADGIDMVSLMPVAAFPGNHGWGYDGVALYAVHEPYGGPAALQRFVDAAHQAGIGVCLDVVYNHLGPSGNYLSQFGPYFTEAHHTPWGEAVNLDQDGSAEVRAFIVDNALRWFRDFHIDALRLDAVHELHDDSPQHILAELACERDALRSELGRQCSLVAESDLNNDSMVTPVEQGGLGMDAQWNDDVHHALHSYLTGERHGYYCDFGDIDTLNHAYQHVFVHDGSFSTFRGKNWGAPASMHRPRNQFVVFASNHDQIGNRALGDRPSTALSPGAQAASAALIMLSPFTPMMFMGETYGAREPFQYFTSHDDPDLARSVSEGRVREFSGHGWEELYGHEVVVPDPQAESTVEASTLALTPSLDDTQRMLAEWNRTLVALRTQYLVPEVWNAYPPSVEELAPRVLHLSGPISVYANLSDIEATIPLVSVTRAWGDVSVNAVELRMAPDSVVLSLNLEG